MNKLPWIPNKTPIKNEAEIHPHEDVEKAHLFHAFDGGSTEIEILNWLHATVLMLKPKYILETGGFEAMGTLPTTSLFNLRGETKTLYLI